LNNFIDSKSSKYSIIATDAKVLQDFQLSSPSEDIHSRSQVRQNKRIKILGLNI